MLADLPFVPPPPPPRYLLVWREAQQVIISHDHQGRPRYGWRWEWRAQPESTLVVARGVISALILNASRHYAGERSGSTGYVWQGVGTLTLADVSTIDLCTGKRDGVPILARIKREARKVQRERDAWLADYAAKERERKRERKRAEMEALRREFGDG